MDHYRFTPEKTPLESDTPKGTEALEKLQDVTITVVGSKSETPEHNLESFGSYIATKIARSLRRVQNDNKYLLLDIPTGGTPESVWPKLKTEFTKGLNGDRLIVMGHEEAWGTYKPGSHSDFDGARKRVLEDNQIPVQAVSTVGLAKHPIQGNFISMHIHEVKREDFPADEAGEKDFYAAEAKAARTSASEHAEVVKILRERPDTVSLGFYGVGTDGHIDEMQTNMMGREESFGKRESYHEPHITYSVEKGLLFWKKDGDGYHTEDNILWKRGAGKDEPVGRAIWQDYPSVHEISALGWRHLLRLDDMIVAFNSKSKSLAFDLAMSGSMTGSVTDMHGEKAMDIERAKGEGEAILTDLREYVRGLEKDGLVPAGTVEKNEALPKGAPKCGPLFAAVYEALDSIEADASNPQYEKMWEFANRYIGKRAPISRLVRMRALVGKKTELVLTPEVIKGTKYETLANS